MTRRNKFYVPLLAVHLTILLSECSPAAQNAPQITVTKTVVVTQAADSATADRSEPSEKNAPLATTPSGAEPSSLPLTLVDAEKSRGVTSGNYYFSSPNGNLYRGIFGDDTPI